MRYSVKVHAGSRVEKVVFLGEGYMEASREGYGGASGEVNDFNGGEVSGKVSGFSGSSGNAGDFDFEIWTRAKAHDGEANEAVVAAISKYFHVAKSLIKIVSGVTSKSKIIEIIDSEK